MYLLGAIERGVSEKARQRLPQLLLPGDRCRLKFDPFDPEEFECPLCGGKFPPETNAGIYGPSDRYAGTMLRRLDMPVPLGGDPRPPRTWA